ncbi:MAG: MFS transporter [Acidobacteria bacterium]|nr:MFS transporter [Acidobacteriota bacterium]
MPSPTVRLSRGASPSDVKPTNARHWVIVFAVTLSILAYIDRVCIAQAAPLISKDLGFSKQEMGMVFSAFALAYAVFEVPGGWLGDWMGPRKVLMRIVIWWSVFTAFTGYMWNLSSMVVCRFLFGAGEAGCFPNLTKAFSVWLPTAERVRAQGIMWSFARWGGAFTPPLVIFVLKFMDWRMAFVTFGAIGVVWAVLFYRWFRDNPKDHPSVNAGELDLLSKVAGNAEGHAHVPWSLLIRTPTVWLLWLQYFLLSFPWYFYITWLPTYLQEHRHLTQAESANYAILPLFGGGLGSLICGLLSPRVAAALGSVKSARRLLASAGFLGAAVMLTVSIQLENPLYAMIAMGMASFCNDLVMPGAWAACMDVGGKYAGTLAGSMNMMGNVAGFVAPNVGGYILQNYKTDTGAADWNLFLYIMAGVYLAGTLVWPFIDPVKPIEQRH